jgi:hypothetical protein
VIAKALNRRKKTCFCLVCLFSFERGEWRKTEGNQKEWGGGRRGVGRVKKKDKKCPRKK